MKINKRLLVGAAFVCCLTIAAVTGHYLTKETVAAQTMAVIEVKPVLVPNIEDQADKKIAYLTFDDGPQPGITDKVLDILKEENIKATFFSTGKMAEKNPDLVKRAFNEGHSIGNHTYSHDYNLLYTTLDGFKADVGRDENILEGIIGQKTKIFRFPGGSYLKKLVPYREEITRQGFEYFDWNVDSSDSKRFGVPTEEIIANTKAGVIKKEKEHVNRLFILLHDGASHTNSMKALKDIIKYLKDNGYEFLPIKETPKQVKF